MRNFKLKLMYLAAFALIFTSCSKDENTVNNDQESVTLTFGTALQDFSRAMTNKEHAGADVGECIDGNPAFAQITIEHGDNNTEVTVVVPILEDTNGYSTAYDEDLEIPVASGETHVSVTLMDFVVWTDDDNDGEPDNVLWVAPKVGSEYAHFVANPLGGDASTWNLRAGSKTYLDVEVLCVDDRDVNLYGYQFFDIEATEAIEFCIFGNYCDEDGRHYPAMYSVNVWSFENGEKGDMLYENLQNTMDIEDGDYYTSPICMFLPDRAGMDEYYFEITLRNSDAYEDVEERIIRAGVINDGDVRDLMDGDDNVDYYHFQAGNCGDIEDSPALLNSDIYFTPLSSMNNSGVNGTATLLLMENSLTVKIRATGYESNMIHPQHIHGFEDGSNAVCPPPFGSPEFMAADTNNDGVIDLVEGIPFYGPVLLNLFEPVNTWPVADASGNVDYERTFELGEEEFEEEGEVISLENLLPLENRTIVLHGMTFEGEYDATLPVACGEIIQVYNGQD
ncbi:hypothetical protein LB467_01625 [Salegentibacter sp. JZCK2]|uniref:hypothetical protein n=1 Tax=Salegentibacter tibetensis TaxID=2873600 RepID=UPI001CCB19BC|nr:hypothetical protein [Salegentibacter tibetensis]MBZ9728374.1 hypothetical protein [Salegentibacter tibetensis]